jgi:hypothetical protein
MANRNVHAGFVVVGYRSSLIELMETLVYNSEEFIAQHESKKQTTNYIDWLSETLSPYVPFLKEKRDNKKFNSVKANILTKFITDLNAIKRIKGILWKLSTANDITHGVVFIYLSRNSRNEIKKCLAELESIITNKKKNENEILAQFTDTELGILKDHLLAQQIYIEKNCGKVIGVVKIHDGVETNIKVNGRNVAYARLDPQLKKIQMFKNSIDHDKLKTISYTVSEKDEENAATQTKQFGVFSGNSMILNDEVAQKMLTLIETENRLPQWLSNTQFGPNKLEGFRITPQNYQKIHQDNDVFSGIDDLTEQQVRSYFLNYVVDDLDDSQSHANRTIEIKTANGRADYFISVNRVYIPFEAKKDIGDGSAVLHQIRKYANISEFAKKEYEASLDKLITKTITINKPHGVVLIGDKNGIYLAYSDNKGKGYFVFRNSQKLFWTCRKITPEIIKDILTCVSEIYQLNDKFTSGSTSTHKILLSNTTYNLVHVEPPKASNSYIISALQPLRPYAGGNADLMDNVASLADAIEGLPKTICPIETLCLCTPVGDNVYFTRIEDVWFPVHINYAGTPTTINYKKYTNVNVFQAPGAPIYIEEHGISLVASTQGLDIMYTDEKGKTTRLYQKIPFNTPDERTQARDTILECYSESE